MWRGVNSVPKCDIRVEKEGQRVKSERRDAAWLVFYWLRSKKPIFSMKSMFPVTG